MKKPTGRRSRKTWEWPYNGRGELACQHGVGHGGIHGCDGCCQAPEFKVAWALRKEQGYGLKRQDPI